MRGRTAFMLLLAAFSFSFSLRKTKNFIPPGTVPITETFFADEAEVSNSSWREYEFWTANKYGWKSKEHLQTLPDTLVWKAQKNYNEPYVTYYYRHAAYQNYPVVGVSYEQAQAYCQWRTEWVRDSYIQAKKKELNIQYRLPTKAEWELISDHRTSVFFHEGKTEKGVYKLNCTHPQDSSQKSGKLFNPDNADVTTPVYSYWKNSFGLFNTFGNVSEMTAEKGISKGGSWYHQLEECRPGKDIPYSKPESWLGFRCVCVISK